MYYTHQSSFAFFEGDGIPFMNVSEIFDQPKPVIGMLHLLPLPGTPGAVDLESVRHRLHADAEILAANGVDGFIVENFGDAPFFPNRVPPHTIALMAALALEEGNRYPQPLGINVLRNDAMAALAVARAVDARFIRVNILTGARVTDQGLIEGEAHGVLRYRELLGGSILIFADVATKHSAPIGDRPLAVEVEDTIHRGKADALIASGEATGKETSVRHLVQVKNVAGDTPVLVGSGVGVDNLREMLERSDGVIVGTALKKDGLTTNPVDPARVAELMRLANEVRRGFDRPALHEATGLCGK